jgi:NitT/TauT family transport system ATP-binding protein
LLADQVIIISSRPGRIVRTLTIDLPRPRDLSLMQSALFQDYAAAIRASISKNA